MVVDLESLLRESMSLCSAVGAVWDLRHLARFDVDAGIVDQDVDGLDLVPNVAGEFGNAGR